jgi:hypothetical protein
MRTFAARSKAAQGAAPARSTKPGAAPRLSQDFSQLWRQATPLARIQAKLTVNRAGDVYEQEADAVADRVMRCSCGGSCSKCSADESLQTKRVQAGDAEQAAAPPIVDEVLASSSQPLDVSARSFMEPRFGHDLGHVRVHADERAAESARAVGALAYTVGSKIVFGRGQYAPATQTGRRLLAHELTHVEQQRGQPAVQRVCDVSQKPTGNAIASQDEADYQRGVKQGRYCKDTGSTGLFHAGRCYREVPSKLGFPGGDQVCFDKDTARCAEDSPDVVSAVWGVNDDGSCKLGFARSLGHFAEDVFPSEPGIVGAGLGLLSGSAIGYASGLGPYRLLGLGTGLLLGTGLGTALGAGSGPLARRLSRRGYVPTLGLSGGLANPAPNLVGEGTWQARLYVGAAKRERPLLRVVYPELRLGVTLIGEAAGKSGESVGPSAITSLVAGLRIDPGQTGGAYISFFGGPALAISGGDKAVGAEAGIAIGHRWRFIGYSANLGYIRDPTRDSGGGGHQLTLGLGVEVGPDKPPPPEAKPRIAPGGMLSQAVVEAIRRELEAKVSPGALMPPQVRARLSGKAAEEAKYMDAHDVAFDLAVLMDNARRSGRTYAKLALWHYGAAGVQGGGTREPIVKEIERIALILRSVLPEQAAGVNTILVNFHHEQAAVQHTIKLPGWTPPVIDLR